MSDKNHFVEVTDNVIILDLLYFIFNKLKTTPVKNVVAICHSFYADNDYVFGEKKNLCEAIGGEYCSDRRSDDKRVKNLEDICQILTRREAGGTFIPKLASLNMNSIPQNNEGEPSLGQIHASINDLKRNVVTTDLLSKSLGALRQEIGVSPS